MNRLSERPVARGIPYGETHPPLPGRVERDAERVRAEGGPDGGGDDHLAHPLALALDHLDELKRERPLDLRLDHRS